MRQGEDAMRNGANPREVELTLALASLELDLVLSQEEARLHGRRPVAGRSGPTNKSPAPGAGGA